jgi:anti-sigma B factor antagonist
METVAADDGGDHVVLRIADELDAYTAPRLRQRLHDLIDEGTVHIIADMREVAFMDSTGLGVLVGALKRARDAEGAEGTLMLVIGSERILRIFRVTGLTKHFPIHPTVTAAIASDAEWCRAIGCADGEGVEEWCVKRGLA